MAGLPSDAQRKARRFAKGLMSLHENEYLQVEPVLPHGGCAYEMGLYERNRLQEQLIKLCSDEALVRSCCQACGITLCS